MKKILFISSIMLMAFGACHNHKHDDNHNHKEHQHTEGEKHSHDHEGDEEDDDVKIPGAIHFSQLQASKIEFEVASPKMQPLGQVIKTTAQIQPVQTDEMIVPARASGVVTFSHKSIMEGEPVAAGQALFSVAATGMAENNAGVKFAEAQSNFVKAEADYNRAQELTKDKIISDKEFLQIKSDYETTKAVYNNMRKNFNVNGQSVSSPLSGFITKLYVTNGEYVDAGQPLVSVSKNKSLVLKADVQMKYASILPFISDVNVVSPDKKEVYSLKALNGKILSFGKSVSDDSYLLPVSFQIENKTGFIPGSLVEIYIKTKSEKPVLTIPNTSLTEEQGAFFVFVQLSEDTYQKREVGRGVTDGQYTEILSGLSEQERVVTKGTVSVKLAQSAGTLDPHAGHAH